MCFYVWHVTRPSEQAKSMLFMVMRGWGQDNAVQILSRKDTWSPSIEEKSSICIGSSAWFYCRASHVSEQPWKRYTCKWQLMWEPCLWWWRTPVERRIHVQLLWLVHHMPSSSPSHSSGGIEARKCLDNSAQMVWKSVCQKMRIANLFPSNL